MRSLFIIFCLFICSVANSQILISEYQELEFLSLDPQESQSFKGTPYLSENFLPGTILIDGKEPVEVLLRYNVLNEEMEIKIAKEKLEIFKLNRNLNTIYEIPPFRYSLYSLKQDGKEINGYFAKGFQGKKASLLIKPTVEVTEAEKAKGYGSDVPASIKIKQEYYIVFADGRVENVRLKEKDIKKLFDSDQVKDYFKKNSLDTVDDLNAFLSFHENSEF